MAPLLSRAGRTSPQAAAAGRGARGAVKSVVAIARGVVHPGLGPHE
jgi:hypothetical protein